MKTETVRDLLDELEPWLPSEYHKKTTLAQMRADNPSREIRSTSTIKNWIAILEAIAKVRAECELDELMSDAKAATLKLMDKEATK